MFSLRLINHIFNFLNYHSQSGSDSCKKSYQKIYHCSAFYLALRLIPIFLPPMMTSSVLLDNYLNPNPFTPVFTLKNLFLVPLLFYPIVLLAAYVYSRNFPVKVVSKGIYGRDYNKKKVFLMWNETSYQEITYKNLLPYYKLKSRNSDQEILVPTFLKNKNKFIAQLKEHNIIIETKNKDLSVKANNKSHFEPMRQNGYIIITTERNQ